MDTPEARENFHIYVSSYYHVTAIEACTTSWHEHVQTKLWGLSKIKSKEDWASTFPWGSKGVKWRRSTDCTLRRYSKFVEMQVYCIFLYSCSIQFTACTFLNRHYFCHSVCKSIYVQSGLQIVKRHVFGLEILPMNSCVIKKIIKNNVLVIETSNMFSLNILHLSYRTPWPSLSIIIPSPESSCSVVQSH